MTFTPRGYLFVRSSAIAVGHWKTSFFALADACIPMDSLVLVHRKVVKRNMRKAKLNNRSDNMGSSIETSTVTAEKSEYEVVNEQLFRTMAIAAVSGSGILANFTEENSERPVALINVREIVDVSLSPKLSKKKRHAFTIYMTSSKLVLAARSEEEAKGWVKAIQDQRRVVKEHNIESTDEYQFVYKKLVTKNMFNKEGHVTFAPLPVVDRSVSGSGAGQAKPEVQLEQDKLADEEGARVSITEPAGTAVEVLEESVALPEEAIGEGKNEQANSETGENVERITIEAPNAKEEVAKDADFDAPDVEHKDAVATASIVSQVNDRTIEYVQAAPASEAQVLHQMAVPGTPALLPIQDDVGAGGTQIIGDHVTIAGAMDGPACAAVSSTETATGLAERVDGRIAAEAKTIVAEVLEEIAQEAATVAALESSPAASADTPSAASEPSPSASADPPRVKKGLFQLYVPIWARQTLRNRK